MLTNVPLKIVQRHNILNVCIYHIISEEKPFNPTDYTELMDPHSHVNKVVLNEANVFAYLQEQGYDISLIMKNCNDN